MRYVESNPEDLNSDTKARIGRPPLGAAVLLLLFCRPEWRNGLLGDLDERYQREVKRRHRGAADLWYLQQVVSSILPLLVSRLRDVGLRGAQVVRCGGSDWAEARDLAKVSIALLLIWGYSAAMLCLAVLTFRFVPRPRADLVVLAEIVANVAFQIYLNVRIEDHYREAALLRSASSV
jgi:hypothetical protein